MSERHELEPMVAVCTAAGIPDALGRELCANAIAGLDYAPPRQRRDTIVRRMIEHRRSHWPAKWTGLALDLTELSRAIVRAYDGCST